MASASPVPPDRASGTDYRPLAAYLLACPRERLSLTFRQLEDEILAHKLPLGAHLQSGWWTNVRSARRPHAQAWLQAGWRVAAVDLYGETVTFAPEGD